MTSSIALCLRGITRKPRVSRVRAMGNEPSHVDDHALVIAVDYGDLRLSVATDRRLLEGFRQRVPVVWVALIASHACNVRADLVALCAMPSVADSRVAIQLRV